MLISVSWDYKLENKQMCELSTPTSLLQAITHLNIQLNPLWLSCIVGNEGTKLPNKFVDLYAFILISYIL